MATFTLDKHVLEKAAALVMKPTDEITEQVADEARQRAPSTKIWHTMGDERVRDPWHVDMDGQVRPSNLRFELESHPWDREHRGLGKSTYMRFPKDKTSRAVVNIEQCRCRPLTETDRDGIRKLISTVESVFKVDKVTGTVVCEGDWVVQCEVGTVYPGDLVAEGTFFMRKAAWTVALRRNRARARR